MPYFITNQSKNCPEWATVKKDGTVLGCHENKRKAIAQMVLLSKLEEIEPGGMLDSPEKGAK